LFSLKKIIFILSLLITIPNANAFGSSKLLEISYKDLPGWSSDNQQGALISFNKSCVKIQKRPANSFLIKTRVGGTYAKWQKICSKISKNVNARDFFENNFTPYAVPAVGENNALFTGYFEIELKGSRTKQAPYLYPVYKTPSDFNSKSKNYSREKINSGILNGKNLEIAWVSDPVRLFFLHVQGSGRIKLIDGSSIKVGFASKNNHKYFSIGKYMVEQGYIDKKTASKDSIEEWLHNHPSQIMTILEKNPSYIFFSENWGDGPIGGQGVPLTPIGSIAVDKDLIPYGAPVWINAQLNGGAKASDITSFQKLLIAQDTGSAIKGPLHIDIFFGHGEEAEKLAGYQNNRGQYFILLPN
jgi:membrane-bound lytic murein transglycosylase A